MKALNIEFFKDVRSLILYRYRLYRVNRDRNYLND